MSVQRYKRRYSAAVLTVRKTKIKNLRCLQAHSFTLKNCLNQSEHFQGAKNCILLLIYFFEAPVWALFRQWNCFKNTSLALDKIQTEPNPNQEKAEVTMDYCVCTQVPNCCRDSHPLSVCFPVAFRLTFILPNNNLSNNTVIIFVDFITVLQFSSAGLSLPLRLPQF